MSPLFRLAFLAGASLLLPAEVSAQATYTEDFTSTAFRDVAATTAHWDTASGTVGLLGPSLVGTYDTPGHAFDADQYGELTVVADGSAVRVIFTRDLVEIGSVPVPAPGVAKDVVVHGDIAVVATGSTGILVVDLSTPVSPSILASADTPGDASHVMMDGSTAIVADGTSALGFSLADPMNPVPLGGYSLPGTILEVEVQGFLGASALGDAGFGVGVGPATQVIDTFGFVSDVKLFGDLIYVCDGAQGLKVVANQGAFSFPVGCYVGNGAATAVELSGERAFLLDSVDGLVLLDVSDPTTPVLAGSVPIAGAEGLVVAGTRVIVAAGAAGLQVVETDVPRSSRLGGGPALGADDIAFLDDRVYAVQSNRIDRIDVSDPTSPQRVNVFTSPSYNFNKIELKGYVGVLGTGSSQRVQVLDFLGAAPSNPRDALAGGEIFEIAIGERHAWITTTNGRLERVNLGTAQTQTIATFATIGGLCIQGNRLYVVAEDRLWAYDIGDPTNEVLLGNSIVATPGALHVRAAGHDAFVSRGQQGCSVFDIRAPSPGPGYPLGVGPVDELAFDRGLLYLTNQAGTRIFDVSQGRVGVGTVPTGPAATRLCPDGDRLYAIDGGATIFEPIRGLPDTVSNVAQSLSIDGEDKLIDEVSLTSVQEPGVSFEITADGGQNWQNVPSDGTWTVLDHPGDDLRWRSTHDVVTAGDNPTCSDLVIDWRNPLPTTFCGSDEVSCPCGNDGAGGAGCDVPQGTGGVLLELLGQDEVANRATLQGTGFPTNNMPTAIVIRSESLEPVPAAFGDGLRCVGTPVVRLAATFAAGGTSIHAFTHGVMAGAGNFHYQLWFRSTPAMFCTPEAFNLSNGRTLTW